LEFLPAPDRLDPHATEAHVWRADLDAPGWPGAEELPEDERLRAEAILRPGAGERWAASRWALRGVLSRYLGQSAGELRFEVGEHGKPRLAPATEPAFNLSHSGNVVLIALASGREVGVDVERIARRPRAFYEDWTEREARLKCLGTGFAARTAEEPPLGIHRLDPGPGYAACLAVSEPVAKLRCWTFDPPLR